MNQTIHNYKNCIIMMVGLSGSGKSTLANRAALEFDAHIISSDAIRAEVFGDENDQLHNKEVFDILHERVHESLKHGNSVIYDATNLNAKRRIAFLNQLKQYKELQKICCVVATPYEVCVKNDSKRNRKVGKAVILKQMKQFQMPFLNEGWDRINVKKMFIDEFSHPILILNKLEDMGHDCAPYHLETIGKHITLVFEQAKNDDYRVKIAALFHDLGKYYTKGFYNAKGEPSEVAHYYGHENVSAYIYLTSLFYTCENQSNDIIWLIQNHMRPYLNGYEKWKIKQNPGLIRLLEHLNKYDLAGIITPS